MTGSVGRSVSRARRGHATPAVGPTDTRCCRGQLEESHAWPGSCALAVVLVATGASLRDEIPRRWRAGRRAAGRSAGRISRVDERIDLIQRQPGHGLAVHVALKLHEVAARRVVQRECATGQPFDGIGLGLGDVAIGVDEALRLGRGWKGRRLRYVPLPDGSPSAPTGGGCVRPALRRGGTGRLAWRQGLAARPTPRPLRGSRSRPRSHLVRAFPPAHAALSACRSSQSRSSERTTRLIPAAPCLRYPRRSPPRAGSRLHCDGSGHAIG